jgi:phosphoserine phosphatase
MSDICSVRLPDGAVPEFYFVDLDGTLLDGSSEKLFLQHLVRRRKLSLSALGRFMFSYALHPGRTIKEGKGWNRSYLKGLSPETVLRESEKCADVLVRKNLREWTVQSVLELNRTGCRTVLLSASLEQIAAFFGHHFQFDRTLASRPEVIDGRFSGYLDGLRPWGKYKKEIMLGICEECDIEPCRCAAAGDSWADRFILNECGCSVAVCPDRKLKKLAIRNNWQIVDGRHVKWA